MKLYNCLFVLFSLVLLSIKLEGINASSLVYNLTYNRLYKTYYAFFARYFSQELMGLLPSPLPLSMASLKNDESNNMAMVAILEDNKELQLGDVLINREGEVFFFLSPTKTDHVISTLMRASNGLCEFHHEIGVYTVIKRYESEATYELDYANDVNVRDRFKVIQEYGEFTLLRSSCYSMVFVAPSSDLDSFVRGELQRRVQRQAAPKPALVEKVAVIEQEERVSRARHDSIDDFLVSPDSIAHLGLLENFSHIQILFGSYDNSNESRFKFIYDKLVPMLLEDKLTLKDAFILVNRAADVFRRDKTIEFIEVEGLEKITVVGDVHGQFIDVLRIFKNLGWPSESKKYLFNGDVVDRGRQSIQCLLLLYALKITFPKSVFINRGNHESEMCGIGTFFKDSHKFDPSGELFKAAQRGFVALPLAHVINDRIYVVHGGVRSEYSIDDLKNVNRFALNESSYKFFCASLWDDASELVGVRDNPSRGPSSRLFGPDVTQAFLERNDLNLLIRSHTYVQSGVELSQGGRCLTIFSAPNYCGQGNVAAVVTFNSNLEPKFSYFKAKKFWAPIEY